MKKHLNFLNLFPLLVFLSFMLIFYHFNSNEIERLQKISDKALNVLLTDKDLVGISKSSVKLSGDKYFCGIEGYEQGNCATKNKEYKYLRQDLDDDLVFYKCEENIIVRTYGRSYEVSKKSPRNLSNTGIELKRGTDGWFRYYHGINKFDLEPCYPWDNLQDYWSRHGKATPEQIQAVIDKGKPTQ